MLKLISIYLIRQDTIHLDHFKQDDGRVVGLAARVQGQWPVARVAVRFIQAH